MPLLSSFRRRLALAVGVGLTVRIAYVLADARKIAPIGDAVTYHEWARTIAAGTGWVQIPRPEFGLFDVEPNPSAEHPPLFSLVLAALWKLGIQSYTGEKLAMCVVGALTVALVGLAAREAAGERAGVIAASLAAVYPLLWVAEGSLLSETLYGPFLAAVLWLGIRFARRPSVGTGVAIGALAGLAALTRGEALLLAPLLMVPLAWRASEAWKDRLRLGAAMLLAMAVVIAPWTIRNFAKFEDPVLISTNSNATFAGANCDATYHGDSLALWRLDCYPRDVEGDESQMATAYRDHGFDYMRDNAGRLPVVMAARFLRVWDLHRPIQAVAYESTEGRPRWVSWLGLALYWPTLALAIAGALLLRRRRVSLVPFLAFALMVSVVAVVYYGITRFRFAAEPALIVLAAVAVDHLVRRRSARKRKEDQRDRGHLPVPVEPGVDQEAR